MATILLVCFAIMLGLYNSMIDSIGISLFTTALMIMCSFLFVAVSSYIVGLVGSSNNPVSGMTISALLVSAALFLVLGYKGDSAILCTLGVAVAVNAIIGIVSSMAVIISLILRYSGRKSCPHSEIQCASSIAIKFTFNSFIFC